MISREEIEKFVTDSCNSQGVNIKVSDEETLRRIIELLRES